MVKKSKETQPEFDQPISAAHTVKCIGSVCFNPDTGKIEIQLSRDDCDIKGIESIVENVLKGAEVEFKVPKKAG